MRGIVRVRHVTALTLLLTMGVGLWTLRRRLVVVTVRGPSMQPSLHPGERLLVRLLPADRLSAGQVVVLAAPDREHAWIIKRVAALPGQPVPHDQVPEITDTHVPSGQLILLGDNPDQSADSRVLGYYAADTVLGVAVRRLSRPTPADPTSPAANVRHLYEHR